MATIDENQGENSHPGLKGEKRGFLRRYAWPPLKVVMYLLFVLVAVVGLLWAVERLARIGVQRSYLGGVYPEDISMARRDFNRPVSHYDYDFVPGVCLEYNILKGNDYEYANKAGFREPREVPLEKPADEYRIFLTGGSTAYGLGAIGEAAPAMGWYAIPYRETLSHALEMILNATAPMEGKKIRVYNAAIWGYAYQHNLMRYIAKLRQFNPDLIVSLDGANELPIVSKLTPDWNYFAEGQFNNILRDIYAYNGPGLASYLTLWLKNNTFIMTYLWAGRDLFQELNAEVRGHPGVMDGASRPDNSSQRSVEEMSQMLDRNIAAVVKVIEDYHGSMKNDGVPHILALQPWFYSSKKSLHEKEQILANMHGYREYYGVPSDQVYRLLIHRVTESAQRKGYFLVDFSDYFDDVSEWVFTDWCHLTAGANYLLAKELANLIKEHLLGRQLSSGDQTAQKNSFFWDLAASGRIIHAPDPKDSEHNVRHILAGYPGEAQYMSKTLGPSDRREVILDLGEVREVSRVRIVWGDKATTPQSWELDISMDEKDWKPFVKGQSSDLDGYSRWPGFEHYAAAPSSGRYMRYRPTGDPLPVMALRSWSVSR